MRKQIIKNLWIAGVLGLLTTTACYDDKGNYDYVELDEVVIDTAGVGIQSAYSIARYDRLTLEPKVTFNGKEVAEGDDSQVDCVWTLYTNGTSAGSSSYVNDTLATTSKLDKEITALAGTYILQLTVTNKETGVQEYLKLNCQIEESITAGWLVLYERADNPGTSDVGLVVNPLVKKHITYNKEYWNLYSASNGEALQGKPLRVYNPIITTNIQNPSDVVCLTDQDLVSVNSATFEKVYNFGDFFYKAPETKKVIHYGTSGMSARRGFMINDNKVYTISYMVVAKGGYYFGNAKSSAVEYGELAPWGCDISSSNEAVVYDQTYGRFLKLTQYASPSQLTQFADQSSSAAFDVNNVGMTLLMGDWGRGAIATYATAYDYLLMQKDSERYLAVADFCSAASNTNVGVGLYDVTASPEIADATSMSASYMGEYVLYGAKNKVYNLAFNASTTASVAWEAPNANEEVTCVRIQKYYYGVFFRMILPNPSTIVHIATWDESTQTGKLYQCTINPASGAISDVQQTYTVPGKVKDMAWKYIFEM